jgi:hypothetical protein
MNCNTNEITFPKEFTCNPSLTAEVLINFMRESEMLLGIVAGIMKLGAQVGEQVAKNTKLK